MSTLNPIGSEAASLDPHDQRKRVFAIVASSSGNLVEWYDFYAYAFTALYFSPAFFSFVKDADPTTQLLYSSAVFAIGFLMRPVGGWLFGWIADRYGRKNSMMISVLMMCAGSLLIAILPTYAVAGVWAPILLLFGRMVQGLSVGGEYGTSATYMSEVALPGRRGFFGSFQYVTLIGGQLLASLVVLLVQLSLTGDEMRAWGWRIPFIIGAVAAVVAFYLRRSLTETLSAETRSQKKAGSIGTLLREHPRAFLTVIGYTAGGSLIFYTFTTYMQKYLVNTAHMNDKTANIVMTAVLFTYMVLQPPFGALSDRIGRKTSMLLFGGLATLGTVPLMYAIADITSPFMAYVLVVIALCIVSFYTSISGLVKAEMFPAEVRALGVGLSYAIANALFGGSAESVALWLKGMGHESWFYWYVTVMCAISFMTALTMLSKHPVYLRGAETE
jgi:metabolite-proton symporter